MAPSRFNTHVPTNYGSQDFFRGAAANEIFNEDPESAAEKALARSSIQPRYEPGDSLGNFSEGVSRSRLLEHNQQLLDTNKTAFANLSLEGKKLSGDDDKVENLVAQALLAFAPIVGGYMMGGNQGGATGAAAGLIGQRVFQQDQKEQEAKAELDLERRRAGLETEREKLLKRDEVLQLGGLKEMEADQNRADNLRNQKEAARYQSDLSVGANRQRLSDETAALQQRENLGLRDGPGSNIAVTAEFIEERAKTLAAQGNEDKSRELLLLAKNVREEGTVVTLGQLDRNYASIRPTKLSATATKSLAAVGGALPSMRLVLPQLREAQEAFGVGQEDSGMGAVGKLGAASISGGIPFGSKILKSATGRDMPDVRSLQRLLLPIGIDIAKAKYGSSSQSEKEGQRIIDSILGPESLAAGQSMVMLYANLNQAVAEAEAAIRAEPPNPVREEGLASLKRYSDEIRSMIEEDQSLTPYILGGRSMGESFAPMGATSRERAERLAAAKARRQGGIAGN